MLSIRRIQRGESRIFRQLRLQALKESPQAFGSTYVDAMERSPESWTTQSDGTSRGSDRSTFIAFTDEYPIGLSALYRLESPQDVGELMQVWVSPDFRRKAVAGALMDVVFYWAEKNNFRAIAAGIRASNAGAMRFYQKYGFVTETGITLDCPGDAAVLIKDVR